jgi:hypothetical protein
MNNRVQQRFDRSIREAVSASGQSEANERFHRRLRQRERIPEVAAVCPPSDVLDALIAKLVERDGSQPE